MGGLSQVIGAAKKILEMPLGGQGVLKGRVIFPALCATVVRGILCLQAQLCLEKTHLQFSDDKLNVLRGR